MDLRDTAFIDAEQSADLFHRHLVGVVQHHNLLVPVRQRGHGFVKNEPELLAGAHVVRLSLRSAGIFGRGKIFMISGACVGGDQADIAQFHHHLPPAVDIDAQALGDFGFGRSALQFRREIPCGGFYLLMTPAKIAGCPIQLTKAIQNRAFNAVLGIAGKRNLFFRVKFGGSVE